MNRKKHEMLVGVLFIVLSITTGVIAEDTDLQYTVMFVASDSHAYGDVFALHPDGGDPIPLITGAYARYPVWSSQNREIAFVSGQPAGNDIFVLNVDEQTIVNLTQNQAYEVHLRWSPDGERIAFATDVTDDWEVFVVNRDGSDLTNLTNKPDASDGWWGLDWSSDSEQIIFTSNRNDRVGIYIMGADGSNQRLLLSNEPPSEDRNPIWLSTGQIVFISHRIHYGIHIMDDRGSGLTFLNPDADFPATGRYGFISGTPDGAHLIFEVNTESIDSTELYLLKLSDASDYVRLTDNDFYDAYPTWIPTSVLESDTFPIHLPDLFQDSGPSPLK